MQQQWEALCLGNCYGTTLHMINAALSKLSKVMSVERVYRAPGGLLPKEFWAPDDSACVGGVEFAFMSAT